MNKNKALDILGKVDVAKANLKRAGRLLAEASIGEGADKNSIKVLLRAAKKHLDEALRELE